MMEKFRCFIAGALIAAFAVTVALAYALSNHAEWASFRGGPRRIGVCIFGIYPDNMAHVIALAFTHRMW
jgi:hypothetical protein